MSIHIVALDSDACPNGMHRLLRFAGGWNVAAGLIMIFGYHEIYSLIEPAKPELTLPIQLVGMMVLLFGFGYFLVDRNPLANRNVLLLGAVSKLVGPLLALGYIVQGILPLVMLPLLAVADLVYLWPFVLMLKQIDCQQESICP